MQQLFMVNAAVDSPMQAFIGLTQFVSCLFHISIIVLLVTISITFDDNHSV